MAICFREAEEKNKYHFKPRCCILSPMHSKVSLTLNCGERKYSIYCKVVDRESGAANAQNI